MGHVFLTICAVLVAATLTVYWQTTSFDLTNCDDQVLHHKQPLVFMGLTTQELPGLPHGSVGWAFNVGYAANWHPLNMAFKIKR